MTPTSGRIQPDSLDAATWRLLGNAVERLEISWAKGTPVPLNALLPSSDRPQFCQILLEVVKVDQELSWESGSRRLLEDYLLEWPQLQTEPAMLTHLLEAECVTRAGLACLPTMEELTARFPLIASQINLGDIQRLATNETLDTSRWKALFSSHHSNVGSDLLQSGERQPLHVGQPFGRYQIESLLGEGGMGWVYLARDTLLQREVALKIPRHADNTIMKRFMRESRAAARIEHNHVCPVYDTGEIDGLWYITMRYVRGESLSQRLENKPFAPCDAARLTVKLAAALSAIHDYGILHRDIKPSNILLDKGGEPLLTDFGLASLHDGALPPEKTSNEHTYRITLPGADTRIDPDSKCRPEGAAPKNHTIPLVGTLHYLAPELLCGSQPDVKTDVYSLGVVLYRMLAGCLPFPRVRGRAIEARQRWTPPLPSQCEQGVPSALDAICMKAISNEPSDRYQSAAEMAEALTEWLAVNDAKPRRRLTRIHRFWPICTATALLFGLTVWYSLWHSSTSNVAIGWGLPRCDLEGTCFYSVPTQSFLNELALADAWAAQGDVALTGDIDGRGDLELVIGEGTTLRALSFRDNETHVWSSATLWTIPDAGWLDLVTDVVGNAAAEIVTSRALGDKLLIRVYDGNGRLLKEFSTSGEIWVGETIHERKAKIRACAVADLQRDGDKEIIATRAIEFGAKCRGPVVFDYETGSELFSPCIGPIPDDISIGRTSDGICIGHGTCGTNNHVTGEDDSVDDKCYAYCWHGPSGRNSWGSARELEGEGFVYSATAFCDFDGDATTEIVASSFRHNGAEMGGDCWPRSDLGRVYVLDSRDGATRPGFERAFDFGVFLGGIADFDGDGTKDLLIGTKDTNLPAYGLSVLRVAPGLPSVYGYAVPGQAITPCAINDINGDGRPEVIAISEVPASAPPDYSVCILDSCLATKIASWKSEKRIDKVVVSDLNGDGVNDIVVKHTGGVSILSAQPRTP